MTTFTLGDYDIATANETVVPVGSPGWFVLQNTIDFSQATVTSDGDEIVESVAVPAYAFIIAAWFYVHTADTGCTDVDVGLTGGDVDALIDGASFAATGWVFATQGVCGMGGTTLGVQVGSSADTVDIEINSSDTVTAKVTLYLLCFLPTLATIPNV